MEEKKKSGFGTAGMVLGIVGVCTSFIPLINNLSFVMGILAVIFGIISLVKKASKGKAIVALVLGILAAIFTINAQASLAESFEELENELNNISNEVNDVMDDASGDNTENLLQNNVNVEFGNMKVTSSYGFYDTELTVKITNISSESKSFTIQIEAVNSEGTRIDTDYLYINNLGAGQSQDSTAFTFVSSDIAPKLKNATFKVVEVSMY